MIYLKQPNLPIEDEYVGVLCSPLPEPVGISNDGEENRLDKVVDDEQIRSQVVRNANLNVYQCAT